MYRVSEPGANVVLAPAAVLGAVLQPALGMVSGSRSEQAIQKLFGSNLSIPDIARDFFGALAPSANIMGEGYIAKQAAAMWIGHNDTPLPEFVQRYQTVFGRAPVTDVQFGTSESMKMINDWAHQSTDGNIPQILNQPLPDTTGFAAGGAFYFKAGWITPFNPILTHPDAFYTNGARSTLDQIFNIPTMHALKMPMQLLEGGNFTFGSIPFKGNFSFFAFVPKDGEHLIDVVNGLGSAFNFVQQNHGGEPVRADVSLPKINFETFDSLMPVFLNGDLAPLVVPCHANNGQPNRDLNGIAPKIDRIDCAFQKTLLKIDEQGGKAAAVAVVAATREACFSQNVEFRLDRPSVVGIAHRSLPIFMVALNNPNGGPA
jgi:serpin B